MPDELDGLQTCPRCTQYRERAFDFERRFWRLSAFVVAAIGNRADQNLPGTQITWEEAFESITQIPYHAAQERAVHDREARKRKAG